MIISLLLSILGIINNVNEKWQEEHPVEVRAFWDEAVYHTGNMEVYALTKNGKFRDYSLRWAEHNKWMGATESNPEKWKYKQYGEGNDYVLFGDWQICFQTYLDLVESQESSGVQETGEDFHKNFLRNNKNLKRCFEVMDYEVALPQHDFWWWCDALYMVMPVLTKMYKMTGDEKYLDKLYKNIQFTDSIMLDDSTGLYYRDGKYVYPKHKSTNGYRDFWARGDGWVLAGLAKVLKDMPATYRHYDFFKQKYIRLARAIVPWQQKGGYWTRSIMDAEHAPGPETSGTALFTYGIVWGVNNGILSKKEFMPVIKKAWKYLSKTALQKDNSVGYVQPIGERAIPGQTVDAKSTSNFGTGAFLLAACEMYRLQRR